MDFVDKKPVNEIQEKINSIEIGTIINFIQSPYKSEISKVETSVLKKDLHIIQEVIKKHIK